MQRADSARPSRAGKPRSGRKIGAGQDRGDALILGAVIAGGKSSRFDSDKALALLGGKPLIEHAADAIRGQVDAMVVCGRTYRDWIGLADRPRPGLGPLGGIAASLDHAAQIGATSVVTIGCDMPDVPADLITMLIEEMPAFCADAPVLGCWPAGFGEQLLAVLAGCSGDHGPSIRRWAIEAGARPISMATPSNINTRADLAAL